MTHPLYDVVIVGAGPVGMSLATGLANKWKATGRDPSLIALVDAKPFEKACQDPRTLALADTSRVRLKDVGFPDNAVPIHQVHVSETGKLGRVLMTARELDREALGWTVTYGELIASMQPAVSACGATVLRGRQVVDVHHHEDDCDIFLDNQDRLKTLLHIDAEGGVFGQSVVRDKTVDYGQSALISTVTAQPSDACPDHPLTVAYERFTPDGPLALLPRSVDGSRFALVWCASPALVQERMALPDAEALATLNQLMGGRVSLTGIGHRLSFPLGLNMKRDTSGLRYAAVGNAAQILHPVAGQGLNLGLRDMDTLVRLLSPDTLAHPAQTEAALAEYSKLRRADRTAIVQVTDWMARGFATRHPLLSAGRQFLMMSLEFLPGARSLFANTMLFGWMRT